MDLRVFEELEMIIIIYKHKTCSPRWTNMFHDSIMYLEIHRWNGFIVCIDVCLKNTSIIEWPIVKEDKHCNFVHIYNDRKQMGGLHPMHLFHIF